MNNLKLIVLTILLALAPFATAADRPNIIFIYGDDHAQHAISAYGSKINKTPRIDELAAEGMLFHESFVGNAICGPARATILTGLHSHSNGKLTNRDPFKDQLPTWSKMLQKAGYHTAMIGKWHIDTPPNGFDHWRWGHGNYYSTAYKTATGTIQNPGAYCSDLFTNDALTWIDGLDKSKPFVVWISHKAAHRTFEPPTRYLTRYDDRDIPEPATLFDDYVGRSPGAAETQMQIKRDLFPAWDLKLPASGDGILDKGAMAIRNKLNPEQLKAWNAAYDPKNQAFFAANLKGKDLIRWKYQRYIKDYLRCVDTLDDSVGAVTDFLKNKGLDKNTIVVYSSDQGFYLGDHGWYDKRWMYEPAFKTPLIIKWPGAVKPGTVNNDLVQNIDMSPTFIEMAGLTPPDNMQGKSLVPLLKQQKVTDWRDAVYYHYHQVDPPQPTQHTVARHYGVRTSQYKLIYVYDHDFFELYDLKNDPEEMNNVAGKSEYANIVKSLKKRLKELRVEYGDTLGKAM